jgi:hypothetical protein
MSNLSSNGSPRGYPLAALFVLVAACAALAGAVTPVLRLAFAGELDEGVLAGAVIASSFGCLILGAIVGVLNFRWLTGAATGAACGLAVGVLAGLLAMTPAKSLPAVAASLVVGSGLMVGIAIVLRPRK